MLIYPVIRVQLAAEPYDHLEGAHVFWRRCTRRHDVAQVAEKNKNENLKAREIYMYAQKPYYHDISNCARSIRLCKQQFNIAKQGM